MIVIESSLLENRCSRCDITKGIVNFTSNQRGLCNECALIYKDEKKRNRVKNRADRFNNNRFKIPIKSKRQKRIYCTSDGSIPLDSNGYKNN